MFGALLVVSLAGCGSEPENIDENVDVVVDEVVDNTEVASPLESLAGKTSLTAEELDLVESVMKPASYTYQTYNYNADEAVDSGEYTYSEDGTDLLIPDETNMISREITSSGIEDGMIYTLTVARFQDQDPVDILYINDPETFQYLAASVSRGEEVTLYTFAY